MKAENIKIKTNLKILYIQSCSVEITSSQEDKTVK